VDHESKPTEDQDSRGKFLRPPIEEAKESRWGLRGKTFWDWLQLLIVPVALAVIGFWFTVQQDARQRQIEDQRAEAEALQAYLDQMSTLLIQHDLRTSEEDSEVRTLARARTATVIQRLDADGNRNVIRFLKEARLVEDGQDSMSLLAGADLQGARLEGADLSSTDLSDANLSEVDLSDANLSNANLSDAYLSSAVLSAAYLREADLSNANLNEADLSEADLSEAFLIAADLSSANLRDVRGVTDEQLYVQAASLEGAIMPDGSKHP
jgi:uncharacterized protein YjbI with pentapeptide repeats